MQFRCTTTLSMTTTHFDKPKLVFRKTFTTAIQLKFISDSVLVLDSCRSQQLQVSFHVAEGLLQSLLPLLQRGAGRIQAFVHISVLLWAKVATRHHQGPQTFLKWWGEGGERIKTQVFGKNATKPQDFRKEKKNQTTRQGSCREEWFQFIIGG